MKLGALDISTVKLGTNQVQAVYQGANLVWQNAPVATAATGVGQTSFTANWNAYTGAVVYLLDVSESSDFSTFVYEDQQVNAPTTSYVVIGLNPNTTYYYRVRASTEALTDADYQAVLDYATTQGYTLPSASQQLLQNQLVVDLKDGGIWSKLDTFSVFATDGDSDFALIDWKRLIQYTAVNSPTFTMNQGFTSNGTSSYILSNFFPLTSSVNYALNSTSFGVYQTQNDNSIFNAHGIYSSNNSGIYLNPKTVGGPIRSWNNSGGVSTGVVSDRNGLTSTIRTDSTNVNHYRDSSLVASYSRSTTALPSNNVVLLASGSPTTVLDFCTDTLHSTYLGSGLTTTEHSNFSAALITYKNAL
jgi:hypothetical protein